VEQAFVVLPESLKRGCAGATQSIAGSAGRACASGTLGVKCGMVDFTNLTSEFSGCVAIHCNAGLGRAVGF